LGGEGVFFWGDGTVSFRGERVSVGVLGFVVVIEKRGREDVEVDVLVAVEAEALTELGGDGSDLVRSGIHGDGCGST
jgi:hypothetical protein